MGLIVTLRSCKASPVIIEEGQSFIGTGMSLLEVFTFDSAHDAGSRVQGAHLQEIQQPL
jgi:hypothetical protein